MYENALFHVIGWLVQITCNDITGRYMEGISSLFFQSISNLPGFLYSESTLKVLVCAQPANDGEIRANATTHRLQDLHGKPGSLLDIALDIAAVPVRSLVGERREKRAYKVTMGHMNFDAVGSSVFNPLGCDCKCVDDIFYFFN
jgi:hypothetical protein